MTRLRRHVPFAAGELLTGFASRLAACNGLGLVEFCRDMGIPLRGVVRGEREAIERLAGLSGGEADVIATGAVGYLTPTTCSVRGQEMRTDGLRRRSLVACPRCLAEDVVAGGAPAVELARSRLAWSVRGIETCPIHRTALRLLEADRLGAPGHDYGAHDFSGRLAPHLRDLDRMADEAGERPSTDLEVYLGNRLDHGIGSVGLLDAMPFHAARVSCLRVGTLVTHGADVRPHTLAEDARRDAEAAGFEAMRCGEAGIHRVLDAFHTRVQVGRASKEGPNGVLGRFWKWLAGGADDVAYGPLRSAVAEHTFENYPMASGSWVLGRPLGRRRWHSLRSASIEAGLSTQRIRRLLAGTGLLAEDHERRETALVLFDADLAAPFLARGVDALDVADVAVRLGVGRDAVRRLAMDGILGTGSRFTVGGGRSMRFEPADVERFVERLLDGVEEVGGGTEALDVAGCAARLRIARVDVLRLAIEDRTLWRGRSAGQEGASSLLLRPEQVEVRLSPTVGGLLTVLPLARLLALPSSDVSVLLRAGTLPSRVLPRPKHGRPVRAVEPSNAWAFAREYASVGMLARETGRPVAGIRHEIALAAIEPAFLAQGIHAPLFRRRDLPPAGGAGHGPPTAMTSAEVAKALRMGSRGVANLIGSGLLPSRVVPQPTSTRKARFVLQTDLDAFVAEFASLGMLAWERSTNIATVHFGLVCAGVRPVPPTDGTDDPIYRRDDIPEASLAAADTMVPLGRAKGASGVGLGHGTVLALVARGLVVVRDVPDPITGRRFRAVSAREIAGFVPLASIARELRRDIDAVASWLRAAGVEPVLPGEARHGPIYRRTDVPALDAGRAGGHGGHEARILTHRAIVRRLGMDGAAVSALIRHGAIPLHEIPRMFRGAPVRAVLQEDVDAFAAEFVGLGALARERGSTVHAARLWLELAGVGPAFPEGTCGTPVYRRTQVPDGTPEGAPDRPMGLRDVARELGTSHAVVQGLLDSGTIACRPTPWGPSRTVHRIVTAGALREFKDAYASLNMLAQETASTVHEVRHRLAAAGVEPAFSRAELDIQLYRRGEIADQGALDRTPTALTPKGIARELGMDRRSVSALLRGGLIASRAVPRPASGKPSYIVVEEDLDRFKAEYATASLLAKERGCKVGSLGRHLAASGVKPVLPGSARCAAVYRRRDLPPSARR